HLQAAGAGLGSLVLVVGEAGAGKTRLLAEIATQAAAAGWLVLRGCAYEAEGTPYLPFTEALREYVRTAPVEVLQAQLGDGAAAARGACRAARSGAALTRGGGRAGRRAQRAAHSPCRGRSSPSADGRQPVLPARAGAATPGRGPGPG